MSLFNRPAWAKSRSTASTDDTEGNIFSHSDRSYRDIVAEQERKKQAKIEKKKAKEERRTSAKRESDTRHDEDAASKRRRISVEDDDLEAESMFPPLVQHISVDEREQEDDTSWNASRQRAPRQKYDEPAEIVELRDSDGEDAHRQDSAFSGNWKISTDALTGSDPYPSKRDGSSRRTERAQAPRPGLPPVGIIDDESDDEFAELARRAREERLQRAQPAKKSHTPDIATRSISPRPEDLDTGQHSLPTPPPDPPVELFITSRIPDTREMIVYRKLSQNLADVRKVWCKKQGFTEDQTKDVFFIHRMRRLYDVTTCKSLGLDVDSFGNVIMKGAEGKEDIDKIHIEAVTDDIFKQVKAEKAREAQNDNMAAESGNAREDPVEVERPQEESLIRLVLKANKRPDFKLKVKPTTTFSKIASAFAKSNLEGGKSAYLSFDGERLDPEDEVQNTDISDMDCIEVHITSA